MLLRFIIHTYIQIERQVFVVVDDDYLSITLKGSMCVYWWIYMAAAARNKQIEIAKKNLQMVPWNNKIIIKWKKNKNKKNEH